MRLLLRTVLFAVLIFLMHSPDALNAQALLIPNYAFSQNTSGIYSAIPLTSGTLIDSGSTMDEGRYAITLPFAFNIDGLNYTSAYIHANGYIALGTTDPGANQYYGIQNANNGFYVVAGMSLNLAGLASGTRLHTQIIGTAPNRTFIVEWKNFGYPSTTVLNVNFQIRLNETTNTINVVYGSCSLGGTSSSLSVQVGLRGLNNGLYCCRSSSASNWTSTSFGGSNSANIVYTTGNNPSSGLTYTFTPPLCTAPNKPTNLVLTPTFTSVSGTFTASSPAANKYLVIRTNGAPLNTIPVNGTTYAINSSLGNGTIINNGSGATFSDFGVLTNTSYTYTIFPFNDQFCIGPPAYNTSNPLRDSVITPGPHAYTWVPTSGSNNWTTATNWLPSRTLPHVGDTLIFSSATAVTANSVPAQTIEYLKVTNGANVTLTSSAAAALSINKMLQVDSGAALTVTGAVTTQFTSPFSNKTATINGKLYLNGNGIFNANYASVTLNDSLIISGTGSYNSGGSITVCNGPVTLSGTGVYQAVGTNTLNRSVNLLGNSLFDITSSTNTQFNDTVNCIGAGARWVTSVNITIGSSFNAGSVYNHRRDSGYIPPARFHPASIINITGVTTASPTFHFISDLGTLIWNCPGQTKSIDVVASLDSIKGDLIVQNTGSYGVSFGINNVKVIGSFIQNAGTVISTTASPITTVGPAMLNTGTLDIGNFGGFISAFSVRGDLQQASGHVITNGFSGNAKITFDGTTHQFVNLGGTVQPVGFNYTLNNASGVTLNGTLPVISGCTNTITAGSWTGPGVFNYGATNTTLIYNTSVSQAVTTVEWPATNGPTHLTLNLAGAYPLNRLYMPGTRTLTGNIDFTRGILVLGSYDLKLNGGFSLSFTADSNKMIAADGAGQFMRLATASTTIKSYEFPVGNGSGIPHASGVQLSMITNSAARYIGVKLRDVKHPYDSSATNYIARYWSFSDDGGAAAYSYKISFQHPFTDVVGGRNYRLSRWNGTAWFKMPSTLSTAATYLKMDVSDTLSSAVHPLGGNDFTGRNNPGNVYSWTGAVSTDFQDPLNWTPNRITKDRSDILQFNSGNSDTAKNVLSETVSAIRCSNYTTALLQAGNYSTSGVISLSMYSDYNTATNELQIDSGSSLISNGTVRPMAMGLGGDSCRAVIAGRFELGGTLGGTTGNTMTFTCTGCVTNIPASGRLVAGEWTNSNSTGFISSDSSTLIIAGTYDHKFSIVAGSIPTATWLPSSLVNISGYTTSTSGPQLSAHRLYNLTYNCPLQTSTCTGNTGTSYIRGALRLISTGTGGWKLGNNATLYANKIFQSGGKMDLARTTGTCNIYVADSFYQTGGTFVNTGTVAQLHFNGANGTQKIAFKDTAPAGPINYHILNAAGLQLSGLGTLTSAFDIGSGGGIQVSMPVNNPITSSLRLRYNPGSTLRFDTAASFAPDSIIYPALDPPAIFAFNIGSNNALTLPGSRTVPERLQMEGGDLIVGANTLTIGSSAASTGGIYYTSGVINLSSGSLSRWYGFTGLPIAPGTASSSSANTGFYPIAYSGANRGVWLYFSTNTALASGGTIAVSHTHAGGLTTGLAVSDGASYTIRSRTNASWTFAAGNGLSMPSATIGLRVSATGLFTTQNAANLRLMQAASVPGTHVAGSGATPNYTAQRSGLLYSDVAGGTFYIGSDSTNFGGPFISISDGNWNSAATWNRNAVPGAGDTVYISPGDTVTANTAASANIIYVMAQGTLSASGNTLSVGNSISNNGTVAIGGGTVTLGTAGGGNTTFVTAAGGTLNVASGTLNVNGSLGFSAAGARFIQSGGAIIIDGNAGGIAAASVPSGTALLALGSASLRWTGGSITIVDPHAGATASSAVAVELAGKSGDTITINHTLIFGDGVSTTSGGHNSGFYLYAPTGSLSLMHFGNIVVNGSPSGNNRMMVPGGQWWINGNLTINNANGYCRTTANIYLGGNLQVNTGATLQSGFGTTTNIIFQTVLSPESPTPVTQTVTGSGTFTNGSTIPATTTNFSNITIANTSPGGVVFNIGDISIYGGISFTKGIMHMANGATVTVMSDINTTSASQATGWVEGRLKSSIVTNSASQSVTLPVGDNNWYTPIVVTGLGNTSITGQLRVSSTPGDHPAIASSFIMPAKSVNRYYTVDSIGTFPLSDFKMTFHWPLANVDSGALWPNFTTATLRNSSWSGSAITALAPSYMEVDAASNGINGIFQMGEAGAAPVITQQPVADTTCAGTTASFTIAAGGATGYQWQANSGSGWTNINNGTLYAGATSATLWVVAPTSALNGYQYRCRAYNAFDTATSAAAALAVNATVSPTVSVSLSSATTVCSGMLVMYTASSVNGGTAPVYKWKVNGIMQTATGSTFSYMPNNADTIVCTLTSNLGCAAPAMVSSAPVVMTVNTMSPTTVAVSASPATPSCPGTNITFTAAVTNGGANPVYQWYVNGSSAGTNSPTFSSATLTNGSAVTCKVTGNAPCVLSPFNVGTSAAVTVVYAPTPIQPGVITGAASVCGTTTQNYSVAAVTGATSYTWTLPSGWSGTSATNTIAATPSSSGGTISVTANNSCGASVAQTLTVTAGTTPSTPSAISGNAVACTGIAQTYSVINDPNITSYSWTLPSGWTGSSTTNSISVTPTTTAGTISVTGTNTCGTSSASTLTLTTGTSPAAPGSVSGNASVCSGVGQTYSVAAVSGATTYTWTLPSGWTGTSSAASISATPSSTGGTVSVTAGNTCGTSTAATLSVTAKAIPAQPSVITGTTAVCSGTSYTYAVTNDPSATSYSWTFPSGWTGASTTNSISPTANSTGGSVSVTATNSCGTSIARTLTVSATTVPAQPAIITGATSVCSGVAQSYGITNDPNVTSYNWTMPSGWTGSSTTNALTATPGTTSGNITVTGTNYCGTGTARVLAVTANTVPVQPSAISGPAAACIGIAQTYSITTIPNATAYTWTLPSGWTGTSTSNSITVTPGTTGGTISVTAGNACGISLARTLAVTTTTVPAAPGAITGSTAICSGTSQTYSIAAVTGATGYAWTLPTGWTGSSVSNSIAATAGTASGLVSVAATNACGSSTTATATVTVTTPPAQPGTISGSTAPCENTGQTYSVPAVPGAASYTWSYPVGWSGASTTNSINLTTTSASGSISVTANNSCGSSTPQTVTISTVPIPAQPSAISGPASACASIAQAYSVSAVTGATSYIWTLPSGWSGTSSTNSISATAGPSGGTVSVTAVNACGTSAPRTLAVTVTAPVIPTVAISVAPGTTVCSGTSVTFSAATTNGGPAPAYTWKRNGTAAGTSATYVTSVLANGDSVTLTFTSNATCATPASVTSPAIYMTVNPSVVPAVNITTTIPPVVCAGVPLTLNTAIANGGSAPQYQWYKNSALIGSASGNSLIVTPVVGTDTFTVSLTSNAVCAIPVTTASNKAVIKGIANVTPVISLSANPGTNVPTGSAVTFTAAWANAGLDSAVVWFKNGAAIPGITGKIYTEPNAQNGDTISVELTNKDGCATPATVRTGLKISTLTGGVGLIGYSKNVSMALLPNPTTGRFRLEAEWGREHIGERVAVNVRNMLGQTVYSTEIKPHTTTWTLNIVLDDGLSGGAYIVEIRSPTLKMAYPLLLKR